MELHILCLLVHITGNTHSSANVHTYIIRHILRRRILVTINSNIFYYEAVLSIFEDYFVFCFCSKANIYHSYICINYFGCKCRNWFSKSFLLSQRRHSLNSNKWNIFFITALCYLHHSANGFVNLLHTNYTQSSLIRHGAW